MSRILVALRRGGVSKEEAEAFIKEATAGTHDAALQTAMRWVNMDARHVGATKNTFDWQDDETAWKERLL